MLFRSIINKNERNFFEGTKGKNALVKLHHRFFYSSPRNKPRLGKTKSKKIFRHSIPFLGAFLAFGAGLLTLFHCFNGGAPQPGALTQSIAAQADGLIQEILSWKGRTATLGGIVNPEKGASLPEKAVPAAVQALHMKRHENEGAVSHDIIDLNKNYHDMIDLNKKLEEPPEEPKEPPEKPKEPTLHDQLKDATLRWLEAREREDKSKLLTRMEAQYPEDKDPSPVLSLCLND